MLTLHHHPTKLGLPYQAGGWSGALVRDALGFSRVEMDTRREKGAAIWKCTS